MSISDINAYCITMDPTNEKRAVKAMGGLKKLGFKDCSFSEGVNLKNVDSEELDKQLRSGLVSTRAYQELKKGRYVHEALSGIGSVGCYLAHLALWKKCLESNETIAIFEDDFDLGDDENIKKIKEAYHDAKDREFDILRLRYDLPSEFSEAHFLSMNLLKIERCLRAEAYIITPKAAKALVQTALPIEMHPDHYLDFASLYHDLNHYGMVSGTKNISDNKNSTIDHNSLLGNTYLKTEISAYDAMKGFINGCLVVFALLFFLYLLVEGISAMKSKK